MPIGTPHPTCDSFTTPPSAWRDACELAVDG